MGCNFRTSDLKMAGLLGWLVVCGLPLLVCTDLAARCGDGLQSPELC